MGDSLFREIKRKKVINIIVASLAVLVLSISSYFLYSKVFRVTADITVSGDGNSITFNSGYYTVDGSGNVYSKAGSEIADTPDSIYSFVSYLSDPYIHAGDSSQLNIYNKSVIVGGTATVLMEGHQTFANLTINTGGTISQPQPDRAGNINRYQYSDQEWAIEFRGFLKVPDGETRKITCETNYETDDSVFTTTRYSGLGGITNASGDDKYYPIRVIFKDDYFDNRDENMEVYLRDGTNAIIDQAGVGSSDPIEFADGTIYGASSSGVVDTSAVGEMRFNYYLLDEYTATVADADNDSWISADLTNAYKTYTNNEVSMSSFFDDNYGEDQDGYFDLKFDDKITWDGTIGSSPFAKGTTNVIDEEVYKNYIYSAKTVNPNILSGSSTRYKELGLGLLIPSGDLNLSGGIIDLSEKGYPGYAYELRTESDGTTYKDNSGSGPTIGGTDYGVAETTDGIPQSGAHIGAGGAGTDGGNSTGQNTSTYDICESVYYGGSGGGSASDLANKPSVGGMGGGFIRISADEIYINSSNEAIKTDGGGGSRVELGWNYFSGGAGGGINITANKIFKDTTYGANNLFQADGGANFTGTGYSGGGGGCVKIVSNYYQDKDSGNDINDDELDDIVTFYGEDGSDITYTGSDGGSYILIEPDSVSTINPQNPSKILTIGGDPDPESVQIGQSGELAVNINGMVDSSFNIQSKSDLIILSDLSCSMSNDIAGSEEGRISKLKPAVKSLIDHTKDMIIEGRDIRLGIADIYGYYNHPLSSDPNVLNDNDFSTSTDYFGVVEDYETYCEGTPAGNGLDMAYDLFEAGYANYSQDQIDERNRFIIFVTDGEENRNPSITGNAWGQFLGTIPVAGSPLYNLVNSTMTNSFGDQVWPKVGLINVGISLNSSYKNFLRKVAKYATEETHPDFTGGYFYEVTDSTPGFGEMLIDALEDVSIQHLTGMGFDFYEQLAAGVVVEDYEIWVNNGIRDTKYESPLKNAVCKEVTNDQDSYDNWKCEIKSELYDEDQFQGHTGFNKFTFRIKFNLNFNSARSGYVDLDQNADDCASDPNSPGDAPWNSYVEYDPTGSVVGQLQAPTQPICVNITPQITIKKELTPIFRGMGSSNIDINNKERFNPYSLMEGDTILVTITASPIVPGIETTIKDELLANDKYICIPEVDSNFVLTNNADYTQINGIMNIYTTPYLEISENATKVIFEDFSLINSNTKATLKYVCKITEREPE